MNLDNLMNLGMEKIALNKDEFEKKIDDPKGWKRWGKKGALYGAGFGGALGAIGGAREGAQEYGIPGAIGGTLGGTIAGGLQGGVTGGLLGAGSGALFADDRKKQKTKEAAADELYIDGLEKIAYTTGIEPEVLDEAIAIHQDEMIKEAEIEELLSQFSDEEVGEILKEAAAENPQLAAMIAEHEEEEENNELAKLAAQIDELTDSEAEALLNEIE